MAGGEDGGSEHRSLSPRTSARRSSRSSLRASSARNNGTVESEDETILLRDLGEGQNPPPSNPQRSASNAGHEAVAGGDRPNANQRRPSQQRVRFSTDIERSEISASNEDSEQPAGSRAHPAGLTVDTARSIAPFTRGAAAGNTSSRLSPASPTSPTSSARNRGYSLRRSLFNKNLTAKSPRESGFIELEHNVQSQPDGVAKDEDKDGGDTTVQVNAAADSVDDGSTIFSDQKEVLNHDGGDGSSSLPYRRRGRKQAIVDTGYGYGRSALKAFQTHVLRMKEIPPSNGGRKIDLEAGRTEPRIDERTGRHYINNFIRSSRYSLWSFFPRQLIAQFSKLANFYFLVISILQMIPGLSTTGTFTTFIPLMVFVGISMAKEGFDDFRRYRLDKEENNRMACVLRPAPTIERKASEPSSDTSSKADDSRHWVVIKWVDIKVGDVIKLERDQPAPADIVLLQADEPNGIAYVETMALDGETNLKSKKPCPPLATACQSTEDIILNEATNFVVEDPNIDLYKFEGNVTVGNEKVPLTNSEVMYRGSILRNTWSAIGMVIYTGEECKIRMNATKNPRIKAPALQAVVNRVVALIVLFVVILAGACTIAYRFWSEDVERESWYLEEAKVEYGPIFTSFLIMYNTMIPISLYVSLEIVKVAQMFLLNDVDMYDEASNTPIEPRTSTINEELGQISYIFSDKTGTLTNNSMRFRKMSVAGTAWLHDADLVEDAADEVNRKKLLSKRRGKKTASRKSSMANPSRPSAVSVSRPSDVSTSSIWRSNRKNRFYHGGHTTEMLQYIAQKPHTLFAKKVKFFIVALALCHTCIPESDEDGEVSFQAASPDEVALVMAAKELGYLVIEREPKTITIRRSLFDSTGETIDETYELLDIIEFSSSRKRMSIIVRMPDQRICIFCKGADSTITSLLKRSSLAAEKVSEIEKRTSKRKAAEAMEIMRRNSEHASRHDGKTSMSIHRSSLAMGRRSSVSGKHRPSVRESIDIWLRGRETDGGIDLREEGNEHYSPRPSMQMGGRNSIALSEGRASFQTDDGEDLVEESLVANEALVFERCFQHLNDFATEGLRTLLYGYRFMGEAEYDEWKRQYHEAATSLVDRQDKVEKIGEQIETQLELIGATAIEDKLQKGVPEAIDKLRRANIKLWMLTGDKRETAINIGHSCRLVKDYSAVIILDHEMGNLDENILSAASKIASGNVAHSVIVVDGQTLSIIENNEMLEDRFFDLAIRADSVICCRASPKQKAFLVRAIRKRVDKAITLAIGDGANDIAMIQEAHVGIGITGKEGLQAARISDYSIAQFRFLLKLLLVHGRWNYVRVCKYTLGTFWKETLFYLTQALYQRWNGYTGTSLYEPWSLSMFNTLFTSLPVIFLGIFEKDLAASTLLAVPELYNKGQRHAGFNIKVYIAWAFMGVCEAMIVYFTMFGLFGEAIFTIDSGVFAMGFLTYSACVIIISAKLQGIEIHDHSFMVIISSVLSIGGWFLWSVILSRRYEASDGIYNVRDNFLLHTGRNLLWWVTLLLAVAAVFVFEITINTIRGTLFPSDVDLFQVYEKDTEIRKRFEEASASELQQGWDRDDKSKRSSFDRTPTPGGVDANAGAESEEETREQQVQKILERRRTELEAENDFNKSQNDDGPTRSSRSLDVHEMFSKGFGTVKASSKT